MPTTKTLVRLCGYIQADLSLRWAHMSEDIFSHFAVQYFYTILKNKQK